MSSLPLRADVVVVGGGIGAFSALYHLTKLGKTDVVLLHDSALSCQQHAPASIRLLWPDSLTAQLVARTRELLSSDDGLQAESGVDVGWNSNGCLYVAGSEDRMSELKTWVTLGKSVAAECTVLSDAEVQDAYPLLTMDDVVGAVLCTSDGNVQAASLAAAYAKAAMKLGAKVFDQCSVTGIDTKDGSRCSRRVCAVRTSRGIIQTSCVLNCAESHAPHIGHLAGIQVPLMVTRSGRAFFDGVEGVCGHADIVDCDHSVQMLVHGDSVACYECAREPELREQASGFSNMDTPSNLEYAQSLVSGELYSKQRLPRLKKAGFQLDYWLDTVTPDGRPLMGESPEVRGFYLSCGYNSNDAMLSGGCGQQIAEWIVHGKPSLDMFKYSISRFNRLCVDNKTWLKERCHEQYCQKYTIKYPHHQPLAGRNIIKDPLHKELLAAGCVFEECHGWERPAWFMTNNRVCKMLEVEQPAEVLSYDYAGTSGHTLHKDYMYRDTALKHDHVFGEQPGCYEMIAAESESALSQDAVLCNKSSLGKLLVYGKDAEAAINWLCAADVGEEGRVAFSCMLNKDGGVEAYATVTRLSADLDSSIIDVKALERTDDEEESTDRDSFYVVCDGNSLTHVQCHVRRVIEDKLFDAHVKDLTLDVGILCLEGPNSYPIMKALLSSDSRGTSKVDEWQQRPIAVGDDHCPALVMHIGTLGHEIHVAMPALLSMYTLIKKAAESSQPHMVHAGFRVLNSIAMEWSHFVWGEDIGSSDTPREAGIAYSCSTGKEYLGNAAIARQSLKKCGISRRCISVTVDSIVNMQLHGNEILLRDGQFLATLRRSEYSYFTDTWLSQVYIPKDPTHSIYDSEVIDEGEFEIEYMTQRHPVRTFLISPLLTDLHHF
ncbi:sarcosine dehydrogenase, mitochondrial-like isoform X1 [Sycon ciliatum]|uniref:sarcosine dehydrogenase, mitochondrial-like isoform X1 n=2 Tax=Sycon ciliatum TaxID=27933 RepID=UPI0031F71B8A